MPSTVRLYDALTSSIAPPKDTVDPVSTAFVSSVTVPVNVCPLTVLIWVSPGANVVVPVTVSELSANKPPPGSPTSPPKLALPLTVRSFGWFSSSIAPPKVNVDPVNTALEPRYVVPVTTRLPLPETAPPVKPRVPAVTVPPVPMVTVPAFVNSPVVVRLVLPGTSSVPLLVRPPESVSSDSDPVTPASTSNTGLGPLPLTITPAAGPVIVWVPPVLLNASWPDVNAIVWVPVKTAGSKLIAMGPRYASARLTAPGRVRPAAVVTTVPEFDSTTRLVWKAPMSTVVPRIRPRWSVVTPATLVPAPMAGLPGSKAMVWVGPP